MIFEREEGNGEGGRRGGGREGRGGKGEREGGGGMKRGGKRNMDVLFHLFIHSLVDSCTCPDQGLNLQPWHMGKDDGLTN